MNVTMNLDEEKDGLNGTRGLRTNSSTDDKKHHQFEDIYLITAYLCALLAFIILLLNVVVLVSYFTMPNRGKQKTPNLMFGFQAVVDIVVAMTAGFTCFFLHPDMLTYDTYAHASFHFLFGYLLFLAPGFLLLTSGERFLAIRFPLRHRIYLNKSKLHSSIVFTFVANTLPSIVFVFHVNFMGLNAVWNQFLITTGLIQLCEIMTVYILLLVTHRTIKNSINDHITQLELLSTSDRCRDVAQNHQNIVTIEKKRDLRITRILLTTCTLYFVTFVPIPTSFLIRGISGNFDRTNAIVENIAVILFFFSAWINPLITLTFIEDYRETFIYLFKHLCCNAQGQRQLFRRLTSVITQSTEVY